ncbi:hypothetical protein [Flavobacterium phage V157]|uniref:Uncharacterized protein n=12 Tax=Ficleduovirus FCV1 TaxID=2560474 RepID=A0A218M8D2_9CAUD|nr:hypothetical protein FDG55_gp44 [Flavobacterium phage FCV-1]ASD51628.1 hypothetical protein [Flavobacterium phage FCV-3]ASD51702.1 hypothetical protein [Flavobacterium phage FCV-11]ASD51776.1 hypothetical protein [Flavobacterium phage V175]ASD51854.1 hypothetical protein [Flavobacterium phage V181]ASD52532.1 hypothetical protein [Flavobacterium phage FCV-10]ASD52605.1 hypothetical protein [Flavobacterium phage FCV-16]ASD52679.1 hypothetical protein [Flavobacterium phage FCV-20]ASD52752.1
MNNSKEIKFVNLELNDKVSLELIDFVVENFRKDNFGDLDSISLPIKGDIKIETILEEFKKEKGYE